MNDPNIAFKNGNIISLTLKNFQIFKFQHISFSPHLNLILAPNGSGKSSIANAFALLFGGSAKTIGKTKEISEYIRFGESSSMIKAEIYWKDRIIVFQRNLLLSDKPSRFISEVLTAKSEYFIDNKHISIKDYLKTLKDMNINTDNLSTFLPQEKVASFCNLKPSGLLEEVLLNSDISLAKFYNLQKEIEELDIAIANKSTSKKLAETTINNMEHALEDLKELETLEDNKFLLECKKMYLKHDEAYENYKKYKSEKLKYEKQIDDCKIEIDDFTKLKNDLLESQIMSNYIESLNILNEQNILIKELYGNIKINLHESECLKNELKSIELNEKNYLIELENKTVEIGKRKVQIINSLDELKELLQRTQIKIELFYNNLIAFIGKKAELNKENHSILKKMDGLKMIGDKLNTIKSYKENENEIDVQIDKLNENEIVKLAEEFDKLMPTVYEYNIPILEVDKKIELIKNKSRELQREIDILESQRVEYSEQKDRRLNLLKNYHLDTYKAVQWLRDNSKYNKTEIFKEEILEPAYLHLNITEKYKSEIESLLNYQLLSSFLVKNENDFKILSKILKDELKLSINIAEIKNIQKETLNQNILNKYNIDGVASDFIDSKPEYINFIISYAHFNLIPISKTNIDENKLFYELPSCKRLIINGNYVEIKRSKYNSKSYVINRRQIQPSKIFLCSKINIDQICSKLQVLKEEREKYCKDMELLIRKKSEHSNKLDDFKKDYSFGLISKKVFCYKENIFVLNNIIENAFNKNFVEKINKNKNEQKINIQKFRELIDKLNNILNIKNIPQIDLVKIKDARVDLENYESRIIFSRHSKEAYEKVLITAIENKNEYKNQAVKYKKEYRNKIKSECEIDTTNIIDNFKTLPETIDKIDGEINFIETKLQVLQKHKGLKEDYNKKEKALMMLCNNINDINERKNQLIFEIQDEEKYLKNILCDYIEPIKFKFQEMFKRFKFEGSLECKLENGEWLLSILVSFRSNEPLIPLCAERQSGGEKSLATVLFLLALQQNTKVPFRLVDEINQGMDAVNEQIVFDILREISYETQFFIITPKLVDDLIFSENTKAIILYCANGITTNIGNSMKSQILN